MLELRNITKDYLAGENTVHALRGIDLQFRNSEFVSILGPSGCGKTTMLNLIGGLDQYTTGDLLIGGRSTKNFHDRDWDTYRNHTVGFVFQSYNLISHQSVLQNVELALTLSGVGKAERRKRAIAALEKVGLGTQLHKKPSELSGGQMQRVAIARAIVNDPEIILADEPTGALDTQTSIQVMEILKEISKDRLIIMVTHNPDLAERYSTRIIQMLDGKVTGDSAPLSPEEYAQENTQAQTVQPEKKKPSMSLRTAFGLSLKNLFTKKGRTTLTAFAGSIGIIGIALIFAVSQGTTSYIDAVQEDTLSSYPLTLEAQHMDMSSLLQLFIGQAKGDTAHENDAVYQKTMLYDLVNALNSDRAKENDLGAFKTYLEQERTTDGSTLQQSVTGVQYTYNTDFLVYTKNADGTVIQSDTQALLQELLVEYFGMDVSSMLNLSEDYGFMNSSTMNSMSIGGASAVLWQEMLSGDDSTLINPLLQGQYDLVYGQWPTAYNEIVLVLDENNELDDMTLYALGLKSKEEIDALAQAALGKRNLEVISAQWSYAEICDMEFRTVFPANCYSYDAATGLYTDLRDTQAGLKYLYDNGITLKVSGIIRPSEEAVSTMLSGSIGYTSALTDYMISNTSDAAALVAQQENPHIDIFTGLPFRENTGNLSDSEKEAAFRSYISALTIEQQAEVYLKIMSIPSQEILDNALAQSLNHTDRAAQEAALSQALTQQMHMDAEQLEQYTAAMSDEDLQELFEQIVQEQAKAQYAAQVQTQLAALTPQQKAAALQTALSTYTVEQFAQYYDEVLDFSDSTYADNLEKLGYVDLSQPSSINLYAATFDAKEQIEDAIAAYNDDVDDLEKISYTDYVGLMMSSVTTIINAITYVLIAFVAVSLIVSSIMIGVITLISVQERTKEIGILRSIGASKKNVSSMFTAETVIIGFTAGALGVLITYLLCIPINLILRHLTGIVNLRAYLPVAAALILVAISILLTLLAGMIPSRSAAKKDPVVALRTE